MYCVAGSTKLSKLFCLFFLLVCSQCVAMVSWPHNTLPCVLMLFYCITVGLLPNMSVTVLNSCHMKSPDGKLATIRGYLYQPNPKEPGQMKIHLFFGLSEDGTVGGDSDCKCIKLCDQTSGNQPFCNICMEFLCFEKLILRAVENF